MLQALRPFLFGRVVRAPLLLDPTLFLEFAEDPVEIVRVDFHLLGDLRSADPGVFLHQGHGLIGTRAAAATPFAGGTASRGGFGRTAGAATAATRATGTAGDCATELCERTLE